MQISQLPKNPKTSFQGIVPPYKIEQGLVYPISKCLEDSDILRISSKRTLLPMGEGQSGIAFDMQDFILKVFKQKENFRSAVKRWCDEVRNLDCLRDLCIKYDDPNYLHNTQKGFLGLKFLDKYYLLSSKVEGKSPHPSENRFNKENLSALVEILTRMDKGMYGETILHTDLRAANVKITDNDAGLIDFGTVAKVKLSGEKISNQIEKSNYSDNQKFILKLFTSDTGYNVGNMRSFEYDLLSHYFVNANSEEARRIFDMYIKLKADYHNEMSKFYVNEFRRTCNADFLQVSKEEEIHSRLLKSLSDDIRNTEIDRIQVNIMLRKVLNSIRFKTALKTEINMDEVFRYFNSVMNNLALRIKKSIELNDLDRICYFNNFKDRMLDYSEFVYDAVDKNPVRCKEVSTAKTSVFVKNKLLDELS